MDGKFSHLWNLLRTTREFFKASLGDYFLIQNRLQ